MPMKPIQRLLFTQGGLCFFCKNPLATAHASVEHLVATANGGSNRDDNCVACCKSLNALLGSMSLKEKIQVVLSQLGEFKCPNGAHKIAQPTPAKAPSVASLNDKYEQLLRNLEQRGRAKPRTLSKLKNMIRELFQKDKISSDEVDSLVQQLKKKGAILISGSSITYNHHVVL